MREFPARENFPRRRGRLLGGALDCLECHPAPQSGARGLRLGHSPHPPLARPRHGLRHDAPACGGALRVPAGSAALPPRADAPGAARDPEECWTGAREPHWLCPGMATRRGALLAWGAPHRGHGQGDCGGPPLLSTLRRDIPRARAKGGEVPEYCGLTPALGAHIIKLKRVEKNAQGARGALEVAGKPVIDTP